MKILKNWIVEDPLRFLLICMAIGLGLPLCLCAVIIGMSYMDNKDYKEAKEDLAYIRENLDEIKAYYVQDKVASADGVAESNETANNDEVNQTDENVVLSSISEYEPKKLTEEDMLYFDLRRLDEKFMYQSSDSRWKHVKEDLYEDSDYFAVTQITADDLANASPGEIIYQEEESSNKYVVVSVPEIQTDAVDQDSRLALTELSKYGIIEVFHYCVSHGMNDYWRANCDLYLYDKEALKKSEGLNVNRGVEYTTWVESRMPMVTYLFGSEEFGSDSELIEKDSFKAVYSRTPFIDNWWNREDYQGNAIFSKNSITLSYGELATMLEYASRCNVSDRGNVDDYYDENGGRRYNEEIDDYESCPNFNLAGYLDGATGPLGESYTFQDGYNGYLFIYPKSLKDIVIAVQGDTIYIGKSKRKAYYGSLDSDVETDILCIGTYYQDDSSDKSDVVEINRDSFTMLTRSTLDQLLNLLRDPNIIWSSVSYD